METQGSQESQGFQKFLLPIREAYEWKPKRILNRIWHIKSLLPIREAYEWKQQTVFAQSKDRCHPCFQFVKRMNGNDV